MKSPEEFKSFYEKDLVPVLDQLESLRKQVLRFGLGITAIVLIAILLLIVLLGVLGESRITIILPIVLLGLGLWYWIPKNKPKENYKHAFKKRLIEPIIHFISPELSYYPTRHITKEKFESSRLFLTRIDKYGGDDYLVGQIDKTYFYFSELHTQEKRKSGGKNQTTTWHTIFKGLFFVADFNKEFSGSTVLVPNFLGKGNTWFKKLFGSNRREKLVKLEDPEISAHFNCYSDDDVKARYILSPALMQRIMQFRHKYPRQAVHISFVDSHVYVAISFTRDLFEPSYFSTVKDFGKVATYFDDIRFVVDIVAEFNLNTRIWTKE